MSADLGKVEAPLDFTVGRCVVPICGLSGDQWHMDLEPGNDEQDYPTWLCNTPSGIRIRRNG